MRHGEDERVEFQLVQHAEQERQVGPFIVCVQVPEEVFVARDLDG